MAYSDAEADALERLEAALDRIETRTQHGLAAAEIPVDAAAIAARLDRLIVQLRDALDAAQAGDV